MHYIFIRMTLLVSTHTTIVNLTYNFLPTNTSSRPLQKLQGISSRQKIARIKASGEVLEKVKRKATITKPKEFSKSPRDINSKKSNREQTISPFREIDKKSRNKR